MRLDDKRQFHAIRVTIIYDFFGVVNMLKKNTNFCREVICLVT